MSIYDKNLEINFFSQKTFLIIVVLLLVLVLVFLLLQQDNTQQKNPLEVRFEKNPIKANETAKIFVKITNKTGKDLENIPVRIYAKEKNEFDIFPMNPQFEGTISYLSNGTSREIAFLINPIGQVLPGSYVIVADTIILDTKFTKEAIINVQ